MKKAIVLVSFGTSDKLQRECSLEGIALAIQEAFPQDVVYLTFSSAMIRSKIQREEGITILSPAQQLEELVKEGYKEALIVPLYLTQAGEYSRLLELLKGYEELIQLVCTRPLLSEADSFDQLITAYIKPHCKEDGYLLLVGHGSKEGGNEAYEGLHEVLTNQQIPSGVLTLEKAQTLEQWATQLQNKGYNKVILMPLMVVAGHHLLVDIGGDEPMSWKKRLLKTGLEVEIIPKGMGESPYFRQLLINKIHQHKNTQGH